VLICSNEGEEARQGHYRAKRSEKSWRSWRKTFLVITKTPRRTAEWLFSSPKVPACQPWGEIYLAMEMDIRRTAEWISDLLPARQSHKTLRLKRRGKPAMEWSHWRVVDLIGDARLTSPSGPKGQNLRTYKLNFKKQKKDPIIFLSNFSIVELWDFHWDLVLLSFRSFLVDLSRVFDIEHFGSL